MYVFYDEKYDSNKKLLICTKMYKKITKQLHSRLIKYVLLLYNHDFILIIISNISKNFEIFNFFFKQDLWKFKTKKAKSTLTFALKPPLCRFPNSPQKPENTTPALSFAARERAAQLTSAARRRVSFNFWNSVRLSVRFSSYLTFGVSGVQRLFLRPLKASNNNNNTHNNNNNDRSGSKDSKAKATTSDVQQRQAEQHVLHAVNKTNRT